MDGKMKIIILFILSAVVFFGIWLANQNVALFFSDSVQPGPVSTISAEQEKILSELLTLKINFTIFQNQKFIKLKPVSLRISARPGAVGQKDIFFTNPKQ